MTNATHPTPYADVNTMLAELVSGVTSVLGDRIVGIYLDGSLASGDFDESSDIDFVVVTEDEVSEASFLKLQAMHAQLSAIDSPWAIQLEGSYLSRRAVRHHDPANAPYPNIERGQSERLKLVEHESSWVIHRHILWERGIVIQGPAPHTLIDPVSPDELRQAMAEVLRSWATHLLDEPAQMSSRGYQSYVVLSLCRILYTLEFGAVVSKRVAANWAQQTLDERWGLLIVRAWQGRQHPGESALPDDVSRTQDLIRFALERSQPYEQLTDEV
jgi:predicted nucleotidyltransferase